MNIRLQHITGACYAPLPAFTANCSAGMNYIQTLSSTGCCSLLTDEQLTLLAGSIAEQSKGLDVTEVYRPPCRNMQGGQVS